MADKLIAMQKIVDGSFREGFEELAESFEIDGADEEVITELRESFFVPNLEQMSENFRNNSKLLKSYLYIFTHDFTEPDKSRYILFPLTETLYYCYDTIKKKLFPMEVSSDQETKYFFENLDNPLFVENEFNEFNLKFIEDNVRDSRDFAGDNHIYLWYENVDMFSLLMYYIDLKPFFERNKFIVLIGEEKSKYPIDFKTEFGIDYGCMTPHKIRIEEMNRICFWVTRYLSGTVFVMDVLNKNKYMSADSTHVYFYMGTKYNGVKLFGSNMFSKILKDIKAEYSIEFLSEIITNKQVEYYREDYRKVYLNVINWLKENSTKTTFTIPELLRAAMLYGYYDKKPNINPRVVPNIVFDPHWENYNNWASVILSFPYRKALNSIRNQVITVGQIYKHDKGIYILGDYQILLTLQDVFQRVYSVVKFEDLKMHPKETSKSLCKFLNIPYDPQMIDDSDLDDVDSCHAEAEKPKTMFDKTSLNRNVDSVLSQFDQVRLQIFFDPINRYYDYPTFDFESCPMTDDDVEFLLKFPFKFEKDYVENAASWKKITRASLRQRLYSQMLNAWRAAKQEKFKFPPVIRPEFDENKKEDDI